MHIAGINKIGELVSLLMESKPYMKHWLLDKSELKKIKTALLEYLYPLLNMEKKKEFWESFISDNKITEIDRFVGLIDIIDDLIYTYDEEIVIRYEKGADLKQEIYDGAVSMMYSGLAKSEWEKIDSTLYEKWKFDIAIDCIRQFDEDTRCYIKERKNLSLFHFSYGMNIRNIYIYPSRKHSCFFADSVSGDIMEIVCSILISNYK